MNPSSRLYATRTLNDAAGSLRSADGQCVVLMGAGCSLSAGIPLASTIVREIEKSFPEAHARARDAAGSGEPGYNLIMEQLSSTQRQKLLNGYIDAAQVNWAHLALAQMFRHEKIDRVLTVNFDPLLMKACALVNFFPAIYDLAVTAQFKRHRIAPRSVFYLNGQHTGFVTLNATEELEAHRTKLKTIVEETGVKRLWLVVGYSGEADPLCEVLAEQAGFDGDLYWLGHDAEPSSRLVASGLFSPGRHAFYVGGQDADVGLTLLAQKLQCFPPELLVKPFQHLQSVVANIRFKSGGDAALAIEQQLSRLLTDAADVERKPADADMAGADEWLLAGEYQRVLNAFVRVAAPDDRARELAAWAHVLHGNDLAKQALTLASAGPSSIADARRIWMRAGQSYALALSINPDMHDAANNWGIALYYEAKAIQATDLRVATRLWAQAGEKYALALAIKADKHDAAYNWGVALAGEAEAIQATDLPAARRLWAQAGEKYALALSIKADEHEAAYGWGIALADEAKTIKATDLPAARRLWAQAGEQYALALRIKTDYHEAANNWGVALAGEAEAIQAADLPAAQQRWALAGEKYALALAIKSDKHDAANNWGVALAGEAQAIQATDLPAAQRLWAQASEHYALALSINPAMHDAANNWGSALHYEANATKATDLPAAQRLWALAGEKYALALALKPDKHDAPYNWGIALADEATSIQATDLPAARRLWALAGEKYAQALAIKADMHDAANNWGSALDDEAKAIQATDLPAAQRLWAQASEQYALALAIKADKHEAAQNWGNALIQQYHACLATDAALAGACLEQAGVLLERHAKMDTSGLNTVAYNLACVYALEGRIDDAVAQLEVRRQSGAMPAHWREDKDLESLRETPAFRAWAEQHFGASETPGASS